MINISKKRRDTTKAYIYIKQLIREYYEQCHINIFDNSNVMNKFPQDANYQNWDKKK